MKLNEIIQSEVSIHDTKDYNPLQMGDHIGTGTYYTSYENPDDPHTIHKFSRQPTISHDGFKIYADYIIKYNLASKNPYFPRIYKHRTNIEPPSDLSYEFEIEKLLLYYDIRIKEFRPILELLFNDSEVEEIMNIHSNEGITIKIARKIRLMITQNIKSKSKLLNQAFFIIQKIIRDNSDIYIDIHEDNIMFRRTNSGIQLVINDPLV
jgi:uncharacterized ubiquitin-like protein YukD